MQTVTFLDNVAFHCITKIHRDDAHYMRRASTALGIQLVACSCFNDLYNGKIMRKEANEIFICIAKGLYYNNVDNFDQVITLFKAERLFWQLIIESMRPLKATNFYLRMIEQQHETCE